MALNLPIENVFTDVLVIGSGGAGLLAALTCAENGMDVLLASKMVVGSGCTFMARHGYAAATGYSHENDCPDVYFGDMMRAGYGLNDPALVRAMVADINQVTEKLDNWGMQAARESTGRFLPKLQLGHSFPRTIHNYDTFGPVIIKCLRQRLALESRVTAYPHLMINDLVIENGRVHAAWGVDSNHNCIVVIRPVITILATGGGGGLYSHTDNPNDCAGDGYALAFNAGCRFVDMEMVEFQPMVCHPASLVRHALNSGSFLRAGSRLYNGIGERFMNKYGLDESTPDRSARMIAIGRELFSGNCTPHNGVYLDLSSVHSEVAGDNPADTKAFTNAGVNLAYQPIELTLGAHTFLGGVRINEHAETEVHGLLAAGEVAGGVHGANRLPGAALADALAFGLRSGLTAVRTIESGGKTISANDVAPFIQERMRVYSKDFGQMEKLRATVRELSSKYLSVVRTEEGLNHVANELAELKQRYNDCPSSTPLPAKAIRTSVEVHNMLILAELIAKSALCRRESRGCHYRLDYPLSDPKWTKSVVLKKQDHDVVLESLELRKGCDKLLICN